MAKTPKHYNRIWRWHFYAGLIIFPILLVMAITGGMYLLQPQIEDTLYSDRLYLSQNYEGSIDHDSLIAKASQVYKATKIHSYQPPQALEQSAQLILTSGDGNKLTVFLHPGTGEILGTVDEKWRLMNIAREIHGGLMMGTPGQLIVEAVACWTLVMMITGLYLWWPRGNKQRGAFAPKLAHKGRKFWREMHAISGAWLSLWIIAIILTGLPWSLVWGDLFSRTGKAMNEGFPEAIFNSRPISTSDSSLPQISMNKLIQKISALELRHDYKIDYPWFEKGVFAVMPLRHGGTAKDAAYVFLDNRTGTVIKDLRWKDMGAFGRASSIGVAFHEGRLFGTANQLLNLAAVITLIGLAITGPIIWWKRKPVGSLGAPKGRNFKLSGFILTIIGLLVLFLPLFGLSVALILLGEYLNKKLFTRHGH